MASFKVNLGIIIEYIANRSGNKLPHSPFNAILCPYLKKHGVRLKRPIIYGGLNRSTL